MAKSKAEIEREIKVVVKADARRAAQRYGAHRMVVAGRGAELVRIGEVVRLGGLHRVRPRDRLLAG
jgi:hypothetical protein